MPAPPMVNLGSGMDTGKVIQQLMELEREPIKRIQKDTERDKMLIKGWEEVRNRTHRLLEASRVLYSYAGPFALREVVSSEPGVITGEAGPGARDVDQDIRVVRLAGFHQIHSDPVENEKQLPAGKFIIRIDESSYDFDFPGGSIQNLVKLIEKRQAENFELFKVRTDAEHTLIGFRSHVSGKKGAIRIQDTAGIFRQIGMIGEIPPEKEESFPLPFTPETTEKPVLAIPGILSETQQDSRFQILEKGEALEILPGGAALIKRSLDPSSTLSWSWESEKSDRAPEDSSASPGKEKSNREGKNGDEKTITESVSTGPDIRVQVGDVELQGYQAERSRRKSVPSGESPDEGPGPGNENPDSSESAPSAGTGSLAIQYAKDGKDEWRRVDRKEWKELSDGTVRMPFSSLTDGGSVKAILFTSPAGRKLTLRHLEEIRGGDTDGPTTGPLHVTEKADDALIRINGIEITRPQNNHLTDVIDGVSLNLHRVTEKPVNIKVKVNGEKITEKIKDWVEAHNDLLKFLKENSFTADAGDFNANRPEQGKKNIGQGLDALQEAQGVFASDATVRRLINTLRGITGAAYPSPERDGFRVLNDIGIHTGNLGQSWEEIKNGYLQLDEEKLKSALTRSPEAVKHLFAADTNTDAIVDNGVAFRMTEELTPYTRRAGGLITVRIDSLKTKIDDNKERVDNMELSLKSKEERLRQKFGKMEQSIRESKSVGGYLKNNLRTE